MKTNRLLVAGFVLVLSLIAKAPVNSGAALGEIIHD